MHASKYSMWQFFNVYGVYEVGTKQGLKRDYLSAFTPAAMSSNPENAIIQGPSYVFSSRNFLDFGTVVFLLLFDY